MRWRSGWRTILSAIAAAAVVAAWRDDVERKASQTPRVRVKAHQLKQWYRTLDQLLAARRRSRSRCSPPPRPLLMRVDLVLYDITRTYFEGRARRAGAHGHSRDGKPHNVQVIVAVVMVSGWPIAHHVWAGNEVDHTTVGEGHRDLHQRFGFNRLVFVGDRGMVTSQNLEAIPRAATATWSASIGGAAAKCRLAQGATGPWIDCRAGITTRERANPPRTRAGGAWRPGACG